MKTIKTNTNKAPIFIGLGAIAAMAAYTFNLQLRLYEAQKRTEQLAKECEDALEACYASLAEHTVSLDMSIEALEKFKLLLSEMDKEDI